MARMSRLDPTSLKLFVRVAEEGTIAAAAEREHLASAAVSKRLSELEAAIGARLLIRTNKGVEPTDAGRALMRLARRALHELDQIPALMEGYASGVRGVVRICASMSAITQFLPSDLRAFADAYPDVQLQLQERISSGAARAVAEDAADVAIFTACAHGDDVESFAYRRDRLALCVPSSHRLASRAGVKLADFADEPLVAMHAGSAIGVAVERAAGLAGRAIEPRISVTSFDAQGMMIGNGFGVGLMPEAVARRHASAFGLSVVAVDEPWAEREFRVGVRRGGAASRAADLLVQHLVAVAQAAPSPPERTIA